MLFDLLEVLINAGFWAATIRIACPLLLATLGELLCERAGVQSRHRRHHVRRRYGRLDRGLYGGGPQCWRSCRQWSARLSACFMPASLCI